MGTPLNNSVVKAFLLLETIRDSPGGLTIAEAAGRTGMTIPTMHRFLGTLRTLGAVETSPAGRYVIGSAIRALARDANEASTARGALDYHVRQLAATLRETAHLAVFDNTMVRYVVKAETERSLKIVSRVGTTLEAYCTGVGKVLLAFQPVEQLEAYIATGGFVAITPRTITDLGLLREELRRIREQGYAVDDEEFETGLRCVAAPIEVKGRVIAALSASAPTSRLTDEAMTRFVDATRRRARMIAADLTARNCSTVDT